MGRFCRFAAHRPAVILSVCFKGAEMERRGMLLAFKVGFYSDLLLIRRSVQSTAACESNKSRFVLNVCANCRAVCPSRNAIG